MNNNINILQLTIAPWESPIFLLKDIIPEKTLVDINYTCISQIEQIPKTAKQNFINLLSIAILYDIAKKNNLQYLLNKTTQDAIQTAKQLTKQLNISFIPYFRLN